MKRTPLWKISEKQALKNKQWRETTLLKWAELRRKCQWCGGYVGNPDGHHPIKRRYNITQEPYICHRLCHSFIEDNNIDVDVYKNKKEWEVKDDTR